MDRAQSTCINLQEVLQNYSTSLNIAPI